MKLSVKSAHTIIILYHPMKIIRENIMRSSANLMVEPTLAIEAVKPLMMHPTLEPPTPCVNSGTTPSCPALSSKTKMYPRRMSGLFEQFCQKDQQILEKCLIEGCRSRTLRRSVCLNVAPTLTVGGLKSMLQSHPWIPKQNLQLVPHNQRPLENDSSRLDECGIKDEDKLLVCMGGSFPITIYELYALEEFDIHVSSCFVTIGTLKDEIYRQRGCAPEDQQLWFHKKLIENKNDTPLVCLGIMPPYLREIFPYLQLVVPKDLKAGELFL